MIKGDSQELFCLEARPVSFLAEKARTIAAAALIGLLADLSPCFRLGMCLGLSADPDVHHRGAPEHDDKLLQRLTGSTAAAMRLLELAIFDSTTVKVE